MWQRTTIGALLSLFAAHAAFGFACIKSSPTDGSQPQCIHWDQHAATVDSFLGVPSNPPLANGTVTWDQNVMGAASPSPESGLNKPNTNRVPLNAAAIHPAISAGSPFPT